MQKENSHPLSLTDYDVTKNHLTRLGLEFREHTVSTGILLLEGDLEYTDVNGNVCKTKPEVEQSVSQISVAEAMRTISHTYYFSHGGKFICLLQN